MKDGISPREYKIWCARNYLQLF